MEILSENIFKWRVNDTHTRLSQNLPIVYINAIDDINGLNNILNNNNLDNLGQPINCAIKICADDTFCEGYCTLQIDSEMEISTPKKDFIITLFSDKNCTSIIDVKLSRTMEERSKYKLKGNYLDRSHARNIVASRLWSEIIKDHELNSSINTYGTIDGFPCKVYIASKYQGLFTLNTPLDDKLFNLDPNNESNCAIIGKDYAITLFNDNTTPAIDGTDWKEIIRGTASEDEINTWKDVYTFITSNSLSNKTDFDYKFNSDSLIDYFIFSTVVCGLDNFAKNQVFITDDLEKWHAVPYNLEATFGLHWDKEHFISHDLKYPEDCRFYNNSTPNVLNLLYYKLITNCKSEIIDRYNELRKSILSYDNIINYFENFISDIANYYTDDKLYWPNIPLIDTNNINQIREWLRLRLEFCDTSIFIEEGGLDTPVIDYVITIDPNNGNSEYQITSTHNTPVELAELFEAYPGKDNSKFIGWFYQENGIEYLYNITIPATLDRYIYAKWAEIPNEIVTTGIDLGLPSGTRWATCNIGSNSPEGYGDYFMWGFTEPSTSGNCNWSTYATKFGYYDDTITDYGLSKYTNADGIIQLLTEDDAAKYNIGLNWHIPSKEEIIELCNNCTWRWTTYNNILGYEVIGSNSNSIFLPAAGFKNDDEIIIEGKNGFYWSSTVDEDCISNAFDLSLGVNNYGWYYSRCLGHVIRPVTTALIIDIEGNNNIDEGESTILSVPLNDLYTYLWSTGDTTSSIEVTEPGEYTVTITDNLGRETYLSRTVNVIAIPNTPIVINGQNEQIITSGNCITPIVLMNKPGVTYILTEESDQRIHLNGDTITSDIIDSNCTATVIALNINGTSCPVPLIINITVLVTLNPGSISTPSSICAGESIIITNNESATGEGVYQWQKFINEEWVNIEGANEANYETDTLTSSTTYRRAWNDLISNEVTVIVNALPIANISGDTSICAGENTILTASEGNSYLWNTEETTQSISVTNSGLYKVIVTNESGCSSESDDFIVTVNPNPIISATNLNLVITEGDAIENIVITNSDSIINSVNLPEGLSIADNIISGVLLNTGVYTFNIVATSNCGCGEEMVTAVITVNEEITESENPELIDPITGHTYVDLGLPSGTLWATCNVGATEPEEYGDYFAWGETQPKSSYTLSNYTYNDNPSELPLTADAASVNWGGNWRMPTHEEQRELINYCTWTWTENYNNTGVEGCIVTSPNDNFIFIPITDSSSTSSHSISYWSASCYKTYGQINLTYSSALYHNNLNQSPHMVGVLKYNGISIRPVKNN